MQFSKINVLLLVGLLFLTGCFDTKQEFTINPDGSGKVVQECSFQPMNFMESDDNKTDPKEKLLSQVREILTKAKGVDAWRDVSYKLLDDGRTYFKGTAYFKDLAKLEIPNQTFLDFTWRKNGGEFVLESSTNKSSSKSEGGFSMSSKKKKQPAPGTKMTEEEIAKSIKDKRAEYTKAKPFITGFFSGMKQETLFHLPGHISSSSNFQKPDAASLAIKVEGAKFLETMDKLVADDNWLRQQVQTGSDMTDDMGRDNNVNALIWGEKAPVRAVIAASAAPLFDYATEVAAAKKEFAKTEKELKVQSGTIAAPAQGGAMKSVKVGGVRLITQSDQKRDLRPFNYDKGYSLALIAELPGSVLEVSEGVMETAIADDGSSLLPEDEWKRKIHFPHLSSDKTAVAFDVELMLPGEKVKGLKELSGHLQYSTASGVKETDLGFTELKAGAKGTEYNCSITSIKDGWNKDGSQNIELAGEFTPSSIKTLTLVDSLGGKTPLKQNGYSGNGRHYTVTFAAKKSIPANARLVAEIYDKLQKFEAPFKLTDITLLETLSK